MNTSLSMNANRKCVLHQRRSRRLPTKMAFPPRLLMSPSSSAVDYNGCTTCQTLQSDHSKALRAFSRLLEERGKAIGQGNLELTLEQRDAVMPADAKCINGRNLLQRHKANEHRV